MPEINKNEVYTSKEVEGLLKISASTLKRMIKVGLIRCNKVGGQYRFLGKEVLRIVSPTLEEKGTEAYRNIKKAVKESTKDW